MPTRDSVVCSKCLKHLPLSRFYFNKRLGRRYNWCKKCHGALCARSPSHRSPQYRLHLSSFNNARRAGVLHTIRRSDIKLPQYCKYLGVRLDYRLASERGSLRSWNAPSIDRINPALGYVPGNIQIISDLANRMKQDATIPQLLAFAQGVLRVHG